MPIQSTVLPLPFAALILVLAACNSGGGGGGGGGGGATPTPSGTPTNLNAEAGYKQITLKWDAVDGVTDYYVYHDQETAPAVDSTADGTKVTGSTSYTFTDLTNDTLYHLAVVAAKDSTISQAARIQATPTFTHPTGLTATAGNTAVTLNWNSIGGISRYAVFYRGDSTADATGDGSTADTSYTFTGLTNGKAYYFSVASIGDAADGTSDRSAEVSATPALAAPQNFTATAGPGNRQVKLSWRAVPGIDGYRLYQKIGSDPTTDSSVDRIAELADASAASYTVNDLTADTQYHFAIIAYVGSKQSEAATATATPLEVSAPTDLTGDIGPANGQVTLSWSKPARVTAYRIYHKAGSSVAKGDNTVDVAGTRTSHTIDNLSTGQHAFTIATVYQGVESATASDITVDVVRVNAPAITSVTPSYEQVIVNWDATSDGTPPTGYIVYVFDQTGDTSAQRSIAEHTTDASTTTATITRLTNDTPYYFKVAGAARDITGDLSALSDQATPKATLLPAPTGFNGTAGPQNGQITLSWIKPVVVDTYRIYYKAGSSVARGDNTTDVSGDRVSHAISGLPAGRHTFTIATVYKGLESVTASDITVDVVQINAPAVTGVTAGDRRVTVQWNPPAGGTTPTSYRVYVFNQNTSTEPADSLKSKEKTTDAASVTITLLENYTAYYFKVAGVVGDITGDLSTLSMPATPSLPQTTGLRGTAGPQNGQVTLSWDKPAQVDDYRIYYKAGSSVARGDNTVDVAGTNTSHTISNLPAGQHAFTIATIYQGIEGVIAPPITVDAVQINAPTVASVTPGDRQVTVEWNPPTGGTSPTGYRVYVFRQNTPTEPADSIKEQTTDAGSTTEVITSLTNHLDYYFKVMAVVGNITGDLSALSQVGRPRFPAPQNLRGSRGAVAAGKGSVDLTWDAVDGAGGYRVYYDTDQAQATPATAAYNKNAGANTSTTITDLTPDEYYFVVTAYDLNGQGNPSASLQTGPIYVKQVSIGGSHGCVLRTDGRIKCWGSNSNKQLGTGGNDDALRAQHISGSRQFTQVSAGSQHTCAIADTSANTLYCWGSNGNSRLGIGLAVSIVRTPIEVTSDVSLVQAGTVTTCAVIGGNNYCWGDQEDGALGNGQTTGDTSTHQRMSGAIKQVKQFALGNFDPLGIKRTGSGCAIDVSNHLWCWGRNAEGQVGQGSNNANYSTPQKVTLVDNRTPVSVSGIAGHYCVALTNGKAQCWGYNGFGQLGNNTTTNQTSPVYVLKGTAGSDHLDNVVDIATGSEHTCAAMKNGEVRCWGSWNTPLGEASRGNDRLIANTSISTGTLGGNAVQMFSGSYTTCAFLDDKVTVKCWGYGTAGQLGNGKTEDNSVPQTVQGLLD